MGAPSPHSSPLQNRSSVSVVCCIRYPSGIVGDSGTLACPPPFTPFTHFTFHPPSPNGHPKVQGSRSHLCKQLPSSLHPLFPAAASAPRPIMQAVARPPPVFVADPHARGRMPPTRPSLYALRWSLVFSESAESTPRTRGLYTPFRKSDFFHNPPPCYATLTSPSISTYAK